MTVTDDQGAGAVRGAIEAAAKRVIGFEIQFGPFVVVVVRRGYDDFQRIKFGASLGRKDV
jgi:hypothetical protein